MASSSANPTAQVQDTALQHGAGGVEVDHDAGSDIDDSSEYSTATTSVASSVFSYVYANGRRYHSDRFKAQYLLPNDETEQERLDLYHHIFLMLLDGKLHTAPLEKPQRVLDVGTGTGIWAIDFADENPQAEIIGTDLSPIQPSWVPPNCRFEIDDMETTWTYPEDYFDYIHIRSLSGCFKNWAKVLEEAYKTTKPGGIVEFQDYSAQCFLSDGTKISGINDDHPICTYGHHIELAFRKNGLILDFAPLAKQHFLDAGFVDVVQQTAIWPIGRWPKDKRLKEIGTFARIGSEQSLSPFGMHVLTKEGWTPQQVEDMCEKIKESYQMGDKKGNKSLVGKYYYQAWFIYGRKPETDEYPK